MTTSHGQPAPPVGLLHAVPTAATATSDAPPSVAELLLAAGGGSSSAWEEIVRRYDRLVWAKVRSFRLQEADALDAVQTTWLRLAENWSRVQQPECLAGWLSTTARRECLHIIRQAKRTVNSAEWVAETFADPSVDPEQCVVDADTTQTLQNLLTQLPPRPRTVLRALFADDPSPYAEVARTAGIPIGSIGPTRIRALQQLRQMVDERGLGQAI